MSYMPVHGWMTDIQRKAGGKNIPYFPTGSRFIGGAEEHSDWDIVLVASDLPHLGRIVAAIEMYFEYAVATGSVFDEQYGTSLKVNWDGHHYNFIVVPDKEQGSIWMRSTLVAKGLQLFDKDLRVRLFESDRERLSPKEYDEIPF